MSKIPPVLMHAASFATCAGEFMVERTPPHLYAGERALLGLVLPPYQRPAVWDVGRQRQQFGLGFRDNGNGPVHRVSHF